MKHWIYITVVLCFGLIKIKIKEVATDGLNYAYAASEDGINWVGDVHEIRNNRGENITDRVKSVLGIA